MSFKFLFPFACAPVSSVSLWTDWNPDGIAIAARMSAEVVVAVYSSKPLNPVSAAIPPFAAMLIDFTTSHSVRIRWMWRMCKECTAEIYFLVLIPIRTNLPVNEWKVWTVICSLRLLLTVAASSTVSMIFFLASSIWLGLPFTKNPLPWAVLILAPLADTMFFITLPLWPITRPMNSSATLTSSSLCSWVETGDDPQPWWERVHLTSGYSQYPVFPSEVIRYLPIKSLKLPSFVHSPSSSFASGDAIFNFIISTVHLQDNLLSLRPTPSMNSSMHAPRPCAPAFWLKKIKRFLSVGSVFTTSNIRYWSVPNCIMGEYLKYNRYKANYMAIIPSSPCGFN